MALELPVRSGHRVRTCYPVTATARQRVGTSIVGTGRRIGLDARWRYTSSTGADPQTASTTGHVGETIEAWINGRIGVTKGRRKKHGSSGTATNAGWYDRLTAGTGPQDTSRPPA